MPLHSQGRRKAEKRSVEMSPPLDRDLALTVPSWTRPPPDECEESQAYTFTPDQAPDTERVMVRMDNHAPTGRLVEFAVVQQTFHQGSWRNVASVDSCHDTDVHMHFYARSTYERTGEPVKLMDLARLSDVQDGYDIAYDHIVIEWAKNLERWQHA